MTSRLFLLMGSLTLTITLVGVVRADDVQTHLRADATGIWSNQTRSIDLGGETPDVRVPPHASREDGVLWHKFESQPIFTTTGISVFDDGVAAGTWLNPPKEFEYFELEGDEVPEWIQSGNECYVSISRHGDVIAGVDYYSATQSAIVYKWSPDSATPDWSYNIGPCALTHRPVLVSPDGSTVAVLVTMTTDPSYTRLYYFDAVSGTAAWYDPPSASFARNQAISERGEYVAIYAAANVYVFDVAAASQRAMINAGASADTIAISGDGSRLAYGWPSLKVHEWDGETYVQLWTRSLTGYYPRACAFSSDNATLAVGWNRTNYLQNRVELFDMPSSTPRWTYLYAIGSGADQDVPDDIAITDDGGYIAVGSWGDAGNTNPEIHVFENASSTPIFTLDTPGSMFDIDIAQHANGAVYVAACGKHVHANTQGRGGDLYLIRLGGGIPGDLDGDGDVDLIDLAQLLSHYGMTSGATYEDGDLDGDGDVDLTDLAALLTNYGS